MMHRSPIAIGFVGAVVTFAGLSPGHGPEALRELIQRARLEAPAAKGDRAPTMQAAGPKRIVRSVEIIGVADTIVVLKDMQGAVLYRSDPTSNATLVAKNADLPSVTVKERASSPVETIPPQRAPQPQVEPGGGGPRRAMPSGCDSVVGVLAHPEQARVPGLCLASAEGAPRS
jgi:hypothetical protein